MPGYDRNRFVNLHEQDEEEFICGICQDIYYKPVVVSCCQQTFCEDCIGEWLQNNQTCPMDRRNIGIDDISPAPKLVLNLLNRLKITCDYKSDGCPHVCTLENLAVHLKNQCEYNPDRKCQDCGSIKAQSGQHNCVRTLIEKVKNLTEKVEDLQSQINSISEVVASGGHQAQNTASNNNFTNQLDSIRQDVNNNEIMNRTTLESLSDSLSNLMLDIQLLKAERDFNR